MSFVLTKDQRIDREIRRVAGEQLSFAAELLLGSNGNRDERIHSTRKTLKRLRGLLRLIRPVLGESTYQAENACLRSAARRLAAARAATARLESFDALLARFEPEAQAAKFAPLRDQLASARASAVDATLDQDTLGQVAAELKLVAQRVDSWPLTNAGWETLAPGLRRTYARGRRAFAHACANPTTEHFHEWRKEVKNHWYHVRLLRRTWHATLRARRKALKRLSDLLGDDHDLADLRAALASQPGTAESNGLVGELCNLADVQHSELISEAGGLGARVYAERPKHLVLRFGAYYEAWQGSKKGAST